MSPTSTSVRRSYYALTASTTLAASLIWGVNTLFLLDAGLSNFEAFAANAFFTAGMVLFEIPTGVVADSWGRRASFLCGTVTLAVTTVLYLLLWQQRADFVWWAIVSALLGLGFTFFSGATEAWLVDALTATHFTGPLEEVFSRGQVLGGVMMLAGSVTGGFLAQLTNLGAPYLARAIILIAVFALAWIVMRDLGFTAERGARPMAEVRRIVNSSVENGLKVPAIRATMVAGAFSGGVGIYVFYSLQPHLLQLWGDPTAYGIAGLVAAIFAGAQILGGLLTLRIRRLFKRRTSAMLALQGTAVAALALNGLIGNFYVVLALIAVYGLVWAADRPVRQAYLNGMIPSRQRATILSFDSLVNSSGGIFAQPALGRSADVWNYQTSYLFSALGSALALPFIARARRIGTPADTATASAGGGPTGAVPPEGTSTDQVDP